MRYIKLYCELVKQSFIRAMAYRMNFITVLLTNFAYFLVQLFFINIIFGEVDLIAGWSKYEMFFYIGTFALVDGLWVFGPYFNLRELPNLIRNGDFDTYLLKPVNSQFFASLRKIDVGSIMSALTGVVMISYAAVSGGFYITVKGIILYVIALFLALLVEYSLYTILICLAFKIMKVDFAEVFHGIVCCFANRPADIYKGLLRKLIITIFPYGLVMTIASRSALSKITVLEYGYIIVISLITFTLSCLCWKIAIRRYGSASS